MKQEQRITLFAMAAIALIFAACGGDSGNNGTETEGYSSSSAEISSSSEPVNSSSVIRSSSSSVQVLSSSLAVSSSSLKEQSSSSVVVSSSSGILSSSSSIEYGTFIYEGQTYKTVTIGTQTWMAENLNYADSVSMTNLKNNSWCYGNSADSCTKYGRLYTWTGAMNIASSYQSVSAAAVISAPHQGVCPTGWHIPTNAEWTVLENMVGDDIAGTVLKSISGWYNDSNGTDAYGFSILPAGSRNYYGDFSIVSYSANFWSATEESMNNAYYRYLDYRHTGISTYIGEKNVAFSVRCLKN